jgi:hypothetical protein
MLELRQQHFYRDAVVRERAGEFGQNIGGARDGFGGDIRKNGQTFAIDYA